MTPEEIKRFNEWSEEQSAHWREGEERRARNIAKREVDNAEAERRTQALEAALRDWFGVYHSFEQDRRVMLALRRWLDWMDNIGLGYAPKVREGPCKCGAVHVQRVVDGRLVWETCLEAQNREKA